MARVKLSAKGWVVIPAEFRKKYNLRPGDTVQVVDYGGVLSLVPVPAGPAAAHAGVLAGDRSLTDAVVEEHRREKAAR